MTLYAVCVIYESGSCEVYICSLQDGLFYLNSDDGPELNKLIKSKVSKVMIDKFLE